jgi:adenylate cyclase
MTFSFRVTLLSLILSVLLTGVLVLGVSSYINARFSLEQLGLQVLAQAAARVEKHVLQSLDIAETEATTINGLITSGWIDPDDHVRMSGYLVEALKARPSLSYLSFGAETGKYYHVFRDRDKQLSLLWLLPYPDGSRRLQEFMIEEDGSRTAFRDIYPSRRTPPYERPYFRAARAAGRPIWTDSYIFLGSGETLDVPGVSRAVPIALDTGIAKESQSWGVLTADFDLFALSRFLRRVSVGEAGFAFLIEIASDGSAHVIAHPGFAHPEPDKRLDLTAPAADGNGRTTVAAHEVSDLRVIELVKQMPADFGTTSQKLQRMQFEAEGRRYLAAYQNLAKSGGPNWLICLIIPEDEVLGLVKRMALVMLAISVLGVAVATALSMRLAHRVAAKLGDIAKETHQVGQFQLTSKPPVDTRIREISELGIALEEMKSGLRSFQKYVPAELVRRILGSGREANLGGTRREITVYFSDLAGFTSIAEQLEPEALVHILSEYLDAMTTEILRHQGTVDKYIGDAIMAFWGAPQDVDNHPLVACKAALACRDSLRSLQTKWLKEGKPALQQRVGLHTGTTIVGNFGSEQRLDYTAIGDTVNLASRLEGLNRTYGTEILVSSYTWAQVKDDILVRPIDRVAVEGKNRGIMVYELIGIEQEVDAALVALTRNYADALECYFDSDWNKAADGFSAVLEQTPGDKAAALMLERCRLFLEKPPGETWDGIFRMQTK